MLELSQCQKNLKNQKLIHRRGNLVAQKKQENKTNKVYLQELIVPRINDCD